ncbi:MAG: hypothetical protein IJJ13_04280 [Lachnospiraceae bacterium]|nr:hypothetical protein [Lachnospiraceae bacterium]
MKQLGKPEIALILYIIFAVVVFVISAFALKVPIVTVALIVLIQAGLAVCMHKAPLWLHVVVIGGELALGIFTKNVVLLILAALLYFASVVVLSFWFHGNMKRERRTAE